LLNPSSSSSSEEPFRVVVISGPSGAGKTTLVERVIRESPVKLVKSVSATTRPARTGEVNGEAYHFLTPEEFARRKERGEFLETAEVFGAGHWYGTLKSEVERAKAAGGWSLLEIDVQGALRVMELYPDAVTIFLKPPSLDVLERRLRDRKTDAESVIQRRLARARDEMRFVDRYRYVVVNDDLDRAVNEVLAILAEQHASGASLASPNVASPR
jgi:guanylate kinase